MNRTQAMKEAVRRWGKNGMAQDKGPRFASTPEARATASAELKKLRDARPKDRRPTREERDAEDALFSAAIRERYSVGKVQTLCGLSFFHVMGTGDSWEQAFAEAERRYPSKLAA